MLNICVLGLTDHQLPGAAGILMARDQEQTLCWQTSWPPDELAPPAEEEEDQECFICLMPSYRFSQH